MKKQIITLSMLVVGFVAGATALSTLANWEPPMSAPPICVAGNPGCDAPINVGINSQIKTGILGLNNAVIKTLRVITQEGTSTDIQGKVLTALNNDGDVVWRDAGGGGSWISIPLNDSAPFDKKCMYRIGGLYQSVFTPFYGTNPTDYIMAVDPLRLTINAADSIVGYIKSDDKTHVYVSWSASSRFGTPGTQLMTDVTINKIEKNCGGVGGGSSDQGNSGTSNFGGIYTSNMQTDNTTFRNCRYANPYTNNCSCPAGYSPHQTWDWDVPNGPYYTDNGANVGVAKTFQCIGSGALPAVSSTPSVGWIGLPPMKTAIPAAGTYIGYPENTTLSPSQWCQQNGYTAAIGQCNGSYGSVNYEGQIGYNTALGTGAWWCVISTVSYRLDPDTKILCTK